MPIRFLLIRATSAKAPSIWEIASISLSMAFRYSLNLDKEADLLNASVQKVLDDGLRTKDIMSDGKKEVTTTDMGDAIISKLK